MKPILYVQKEKHSKVFDFDFCYHAMMGARKMGHVVHPFFDINLVPGKPNHIIVGSVESCSTWLETNGYDVPKMIDLEPFRQYLKRTLEVMDISEVPELLKTKEVFVKPFEKIKGFTGMVVNRKLILDVFSEGYKGLVSVQGVLDIVSEYRVYITDNKILGIKHYSGDFLKFPQGNFIKQVFETAKENITHHSYTLDIGVLEDGTSVLIEINDGFAIGNYGLEPLEYYIFCRNRWLQLTGLRK